MLVIKRVMIFLLIGILFTTIAKAQTTSFTGMTVYGGEYNSGVIFKTDSAGGNVQDIYHFEKELAGNPDHVRFLKASDGMLYSTTSGVWGGLESSTIYRVDPSTDSVEHIFIFDTALHGKVPTGDLIELSPGILYGICREGGIYDKGTLFTYNISTGIFTKLRDFNGIASGENPSGLMMASNGKLYGTTMNGGISSNGIIYEFDTATNTFTKKIDFNNSNGKYPRGYLAEVNGKIYGTTHFGGNSGGSGVLYEYDPALDLYTKKIDLSGSSTGGSPISGVIAANGHIYGTTTYGGTNGAGVLFDYFPATDTYTKLYDFNGTTDGGWPEGGLLLAENDKLYGMSRYGGAFGYGTFYAFDLQQQQYSMLYNMEGPKYGRSPMQAMIEYSSGLIYGIAYGGAEIAGMLFKYDYSSDQHTKFHDFFCAPHGEKPPGAFIQGENGNLFALASDGGYYGRGTLFEYCPGSNITVLRHSFENNSGWSPSGNLLLADDGKMYGLASKGGTSDNGTLFSFNPVTSEFEKLHDFDDSNTGRIPVGSLIQSTNGRLYGMTKYGGSNGKGVIFEFDITTGTCTKLNDFDGANNGSNPVESLLETAPNVFYGLTLNGGFNNDGVLFEYDASSGIFTKHYDLNNNGSNPRGSLMQASNGKLYGLTSSGGVGGTGTIFSFDTSIPTFSYEASFAYAVNCSTPHGTLVEGSSGKLYGTTSIGGNNNDGTIFEFDMTSQVISKTHTFEDSIGRFPVSHLLQTDSCYAPCIPTFTSSNGNLICPGDTTILSVSNTSILNDANLWHLYSGSCGGTLIESNTTGIFEVNPALTTSYYLRGEGGCLSNLTCISLTIKAEDTIAPYVSSMDTVYGTCTGVTLTPPVAQDNCADSVTATTSDPIIYNVVGDYVVNWSFDDGNGNAVVVPQYVIVEDTDPPLPDVTSLPSVTESCIVNSITAPLATDECDGTITGVSNTPFPITNSTFVTWTYTDSEGNSSSQIQNVSVIDTLAPVPDLSVLPLIEEDCIVSSLPIQTATDNCEGTIIGTNDAMLPITGAGNYTVTWTYTDANNNSVTQVQQVNINYDTIDVGISWNENTITLSADDLGAQAYQWIDCSDNNQLNGENSASFTPSSNGEYAVIISNGNCSDTSQCHTVNTIGLNDWKLNDISLYPNPTSGIFWIVSEYEIVSVELFDLIGKKIQIETDLHQKMINPTALSPGKYMVRIKTAEQIVWTGNLLIF